MARVETRHFREPYDRNVSIAVLAALRRFHMAWWGRQQFCGRRCLARKMDHLPRRGYLCRHREERPAVSAELADVARNHLRAAGGTFERRPVARFCPRGSRLFRQWHATAGTVSHALAVDR